MPDNLDTPFGIFERNPDGTPGTRLGGAHDAVSAAVVASFMYATVQEMSPETARAIVVLDDVGATSSWIGREPEAT